MIPHEIYSEDGRTWLCQGRAMNQDAYMYSDYDADSGMVTMYYVPTPQLLRGSSWFDGSGRRWSVHPEIMFPEVLRVSAGL